MRRALAACLGLLVWQGCGGRAARPAPPLRVDEGWTATPLDGALPRAGCRFGGAGAECDEGCTVRVHAEEGDRAHDEEHRVGARATVVLVRRDDGTASVRASVAQASARLDVFLELPASPEAGLDSALALLAPATTLPSGAILTRTYELREPAATYTLHERSGRARVVRAERREAEEGLAAWTRSSREERPADASGPVWELRTVESTAWLSDRTRRIETRYAGAGPPAERSVTEELDAAGRVVRVRHHASWHPRGPQPDLVLEYDEHGALAAARWEGTSPAADDAGWRRFPVLRDERGRQIGDQSPDGSREDVFERDAAGRLVALRDPIAHFELEARRDASGGVVEERATSAAGGETWTSILRRTRDEHGLLVRSEREERGSDESGETVTRSVITYRYEGRCAERPLAALPGHDALLDSPFDLLPDE